MKKQPNPWQEEARRLAVLWITTAIWTDFTNTVKPDWRLTHADVHALVTSLAMCDQAARDRWAEKAGARSPSRTTWCDVLTAVARRGHRITNELHARAAGGAW